MLVFMRGRIKENAGAADYHTVFAGDLTEDGTEISEENTEIQDEASKTEIKNTETEERKNEQTD